MILVCLSHFSAVYLVRHSASMLSELPLLIGLIASPTFALMSGTMLGVLYVVQRTGFAALREKLFDRALFLLTVAHLLIACSRLVFETHAAYALRMTFMTDAIGVSVIVGLLLIDRVSSLTRVVIGATLYSVSAELALFWQPHRPTLELAKELLVGSYPLHVLAYSVPVLPWLGLYLACTAFGEHIGSLYRRNDVAGVERSFFRVGAVGAASGVGLRLGGWLLGTVHIAARYRPFLTSLGPALSPTMKLPPAPAYMLFFGGLGALLISGVAYIDHRGQAEAVMRWAAMLGRCSLVVFIFQFYVYYSLIGPAHLPYTHAWPLIFAGSLGVISLFAAWWDARRMNWMLTIGLLQCRAWLHAHHARAESRLVH